MMKKTTLIILLFILCHLSKAQTVNLYNQNDVNNFSVNYPGDSSFTSISIDGADITNLNGLSQVTEVTGNLYISSPTNTHPLTDISGLNNVISVGGRLTLIDIPNINANNLFPNLTQIGSGVNGNGLYIYGLTPATINGFNALTNVSGDLALQGTSLLINLNGFNGLTKIKSPSNNQASFYFLNNSALTSINGFSALNEVGWEYYFVNNPSLTSLPNTPNLSVIGKSITVWQDHAITNFNGLNGLTTMTGGGLNIKLNNNLVSFSGLNNLTVTNGINILNNPVLSSLTALASLTTFPPSSNRPFINISNNNILTSLTGLDNINGATIGQVVLQNNPNLSICAIESFCEKIAFDTNLLGFTQVSNNATNCNSADDINNECLLLSTNEIEANQAISIYPNPVQSILNLKTSNPTAIIISDVLGRIRMNTMVDNGTIDVSGLEKGIYFIKATCNNKISNTKLIKE